MEMKECPYKENRSECALAKGGISCDLCKRQALDMQAAEHMETKERVIKSWEWFKNWFDGLIDEKNVNIPQRTLNSYTMLKNVMNGLLKLAPAMPEFEDTVHVFKMELLNEILDDAGIGDAEEEDKDREYSGVLLQ